MVIYKKHSKSGMSSVESKDTKPELIVRTTCGNVVFDTDQIL